MNQSIKTREMMQVNRKNYTRQSPTTVWICNWNDRWTNRKKVNWKLEMKGR